jgi:hypothetical protein
MLRRLCAFVALLLAFPLAANAGSISSGFTGTHGSMGAFVDVTATNGINVTGFDMNLADTSMTVSVYIKAATGATTLADTTNAAAWTLFASNIAVTGNGQGVATHVQLTNPIPIAAGQTKAIYLVTSSNGDIFNFCCEAPGGVTSASNADASFIGAYESHALFGTTYNGWGFEGTVYYDLASPAAPVPTLSEWGQIVLALVLLAAGGWYLRRGKNQA